MSWPCRRRLVVESFVVGNYSAILSSFVFRVFGQIIQFLPGRKLRFLPAGFGNSYWNPYCCTLTMPSWLGSRSSLLGCLPQIPILGAHKFLVVETKGCWSKAVIGLCQSRGPFLMCGQSRELKFGPTVGCQVRSLARSVCWLYYARKIIIPILSSNQVSPLTQLRTSWEAERSLSVTLRPPSCLVLMRQFQIRYKLDKKRIRLVTIPHGYLLTTIGR